MRERKILGGDEDLRLLADRGEQLVHAHQRAQRIAVWVLMRGEHEARVLADPLQHLVAGRALADRAHESSISASSASTRSARSVVSS